MDSLPGKTAQKVAWVLKLIEELEIVPATFLKKLGGTDDLWEVRIQIGGEAIRLLGFFASRSLLVLNHAFLKKTNKTPMRHIRLAESRKRDYLNMNRG